MRSSTPDADDDVLHVSVLREQEDAREDGCLYTGEVIGDITPAPPAPSQLQYQASGQR